MCSSSSSSKFGLIYYCVLPLLDLGLQFAFILVISHLSMISGPILCRSSSYFSCRILPLQTLHPSPFLCHPYFFQNNLYFNFPEKPSLNFYPRMPFSPSDDSGPLPYWSAFCFRPFNYVLHIINTVYSGLFSNFHLPDVGNFFSFKIPIFIAV